MGGGYGKGGGWLSRLTGYAVQGDPSNTIVVQASVG